MMTDILLTVIAIGVIYLCLNQPIPNGDGRRSWLQQWFFLWRHRKGRR